MAVDYLAIARQAAAARPAARKWPADYGVRHTSEWDKFWSELSGEAADQGLRNLARRVFAVEQGDRIAIETLQRLATEAAEKRTAPYEAMCTAIVAEHQNMAARLENVVKQMEAAQKSRAEQDRRIEVVRGDLMKQVERLDRAIAALPVEWRKDFVRLIDELRTTPDAATALLFGAETFASNVSRSLEQAQ